MTEAIFLQALGWAIFNSLWQLAFLWVIYQVSLAVYPSMKAGLRSQLASGLLAGGFFWFIFTLVSGLKNKASLAHIFSASTQSDSLLGMINHYIQVSLPYASIAYLALLILPILRFTRNYRYVQVIRHNGLHKIAPEWRLFVDRISQHMGIKKKVQIWVSEWVNSPVTIGFLKPVILVPIAAVNHLSTSQLEAILLHEISHIQKMDYLINLLMNCIRVVLYFNPFANAFIRIVETEREKSCDEMVLQFEYASHDYATALLTLEKMTRPNQVLVLAATGKNELLSRVEEMLGIRKKERFDMRRAMAICIGLLSIICVNALTVITKENKPDTENVYATDLESAGVNNLASVSEQPEQIITNAIRQSPAISKPAERPAIKPSPLPAPPGDPGYKLVNYSIPMVTEAVLSKTQELQVKQAMATSKKLLENVQVMQMEKNLADAFSQQEKEALKKEWRQEMNKLDWGKLENKLRSAYEQVDWNRVNLQLNSAIRQMQADSLINVYTKAICELNMVQKQLNEDSLTAIPDTDVTLKVIANKQKMIEKALNQLKTVSTNKKVIRL